MWRPISFTVRDGILIFFRVFWKKCLRNGLLTSRPNLSKRPNQIFLREHHNFDHWVNAFGPAEHAVFGLLSKASDGMLPELQLRQQLPKALISNLDKALTFLSYHGLIDDSILDEPRLTCTLFRDWYQAKHPFPTYSETPDRMPAPAPLPTNPPTPQMNITVSPVIQVKGGTSLFRWDHPFRKSGISFKTSPVLLTILASRIRRKLNFAMCWERADENWTNQNHWASRIRKRSAPHWKRPETFYNPQKRRPVRFNNFWKRLRKLPRTSGRLLAG